MLHPWRAPSAFDESGCGCEDGAAAEVEISLKRSRAFARSLACFRSVVAIVGMVSMLSFQGAAVAVAIALPFVFYTLLWRRPQRWVQYCGKDVDPSHRMAVVSHSLKLLQVLALASVSVFSIPPWYCIALVVAGQYLNYKTYELLGEAGVYYGALFGKQLPWVKKFPFGYIRDPQYWGAILSLLGVTCWAPWKFVLLWILGYFYMMIMEHEENPDLRATKIS